MMSRCLWAVVALFAGFQLATSMRYQTTGTTRQATYRYVYPANRVITGPNVCKSTCCSGWQLNAYTGRCTIPICQPPCQNGGRCLRPGSCVCPTGYAGTYCQYQAYVRTGSGSASSIHTSSSGSVRPGTGGYSRITSSTSTRPLTGTSTATFSIRPGSSTSSRTYISRVRPGTATTGSRTYAVTYTTGGRGNVVSTNGQRPYQSTHLSPSSSSSGSSSHSTSAVGLPSSQTLARFTMRGPCFRRVSSSHCMAPLSDMTTLHDDCCSTVGQGWGNGCYACPQVLGQELHCPSGFKKSPDTGNCIDVDECNAFDNICMHGSCLNSQGSYRCRCDQGYMSDTSGTQCVVSVKQMCYTRVINGQCYGGGGSRMPTTQMQCCCSLGSAWGAACERCPQQGSAEFRAMCPQVSAIVSSGNPRPTQNVDPCATNSRLCLNGQCINSGNGAYRCECSRGFRLSSRGNQCIDVNECSESRDICNGGRCLNTYGSFHCICSRGLVLRGGVCEDIDECTVRNVNPCAEYVCQNTLGSYHCLRTECTNGYRYDITHQRCVDVNECSDANVCEHGRCINIEGSYRCLCPQGFTSNPTETDCIDVDECGQTRDTPLCGEEAICVNEVGVYRCVCTGDTVYDSESRTCQTPVEVQGAPEIVEVDRKDCYGSISDMNFCSNLLGSNVTQQECCCTVGAGWGDDCDLIVCPSQGTLAYNETCPVGQGKHVITLRRPVETVNVPTTYPEAAAHPSAGQEASILGINECEIFPELCGPAACVDKEILYDCNCPEGYKFDDASKTCIVHDSCFVYQGVCGNASCENTENSYNCKCPGSYEFDASLRRCMSIDHCESPGICGNGTCTSTERGPVCSCPEGHRFVPSQRSCEVQDYCIVYNGVCGNGTCVNRADGYDCRCPEGQRFNERSSACEVTNFCVVLSGICGNGTCIPTENGYTCRCPSGFQFDSDGGFCKDIDLCVDHSALCGNGTCVDQGQNFICICPEGFQFSNTKVCIDINECSTPTSHSCGLEASCINTHGSHHCACPGGFEFNPASRTCDDINECRLLPDLCGNATCTNTDGSYQCSCAFGFMYNQTLGMCIDTNECAVYRSICSNGTCMNTQGSYRCVCPRGYEYISGNGNGCLDINECSSVPGLCGDATCLNREGSFLCGCDPGYYFEEQDRICVDINECFLSEEICGNGQCENSVGSFRCICPDGANFDEAGRQCTALESHTTSRDPEAIEADRCTSLCGNATCATDASGLVCTCQPGYQYDTASKSCVDLDECERSPEICGTATCQNRIGGYTCMCSEGYVYKRKKKICGDLNECKKYRTLCANGRCVNKKGTFVCLCSPGQQFSYNSRRCVAAASMTVCNRNPGICGNATCSSEGHSIRCLCPAGYDYDVTIKACNTIGECDQPNRCGEGALCEDTVAGYRCVCTAGYIYNYQDGGCREIPQPPPEASGGVGYRPAVTQTTPPKRGLNECNSSPCINGVCIDRPDGFICQCVEGYHLVDSVTCEDTNECESPDAQDICMYGNCVNEPPGSFTCECTDGLTLDSTGRRCIELIGPVSGGGIDGGIPPEEPLGPCWGQSDPNQDICSNVVSQESTYQQCCCNTGLSWGKECYSCPLRHSEEYRMLCVALSLFNNQDGIINQQADQPVPGVPRS
eukprot:XP_011666114.1 PREDICTED: fibrillin-1 isoform X3 [Strongylocentrotus purpuratus]